MQSRRIIFVPIVSILAAATSASPDVLHLTGGERLDCEVIEENEATLRIRTTDGVFDIEKDRIVRRQAAPSPWQRYAAEKRKTRDTPDGHVRLAEWCAANGLAAERVRHLERAVELDPDHAAARRALGFEKKDSQWVKRTARKSKRPSDAALRAQREARDAEQRQRERIAELHVRIQAIYRGRLENRTWNDDLFRDGRQLILSMDDPLAIPGLMKVLSQGNLSARRLLIEALSRFDSDEATMNLLVVALLDRTDRVRRAAATALVDRKDDRVVAELRSALYGEEEGLIRHAATALGILKADAAVEDLIATLKTQALATVDTCIPLFLDSVYYTFGACRHRHHHAGSHRCSAGGFGLYPYYPVGSLYPMGTLCDYETRYVDVHRTEVQEALIAITGQNFGFDRAAWRRWWQAHRPRGEPPANP